MDMENFVRLIIDLGVRVRLVEVSCLIEVVSVWLIRDSIWNFEKCPLNGGPLITGFTVNDLRQGNEIAFLALAAGFAVRGHLSNWTIYELEEQFSKLAPSNMHWPTLHVLQQGSILVLSDEYEQKM